MTMSVARKSDGLLSAEGVSRLLALTSENRGNVDDIFTLAKTMNLGSGARISNSLNLLFELGLVQSNVAGRIEAMNTGSNVEDCHSAVRQALADYYSLKFTLEVGSTIFKRDPNSGELLVDRERLPLKQQQLPYLIADYQILERKPGRHWRVKQEFRNKFESIITMGNHQSVSGSPLTPEALSLWLKNRKQAGEVAEVFVLEFERLRLKKHPSLDQLRWISTEDASAGYDLLSFDGLHSVSLDRCIEIKGHGGNRAFHWSKGEIEKAQQLSTKYWLYLVDRNQIDNPGYAPEIYQDPYSYFIETNPECWRKEATTFNFSPGV